MSSAERTDAATDPGGAKEGGPGSDRPGLLERVHGWVLDHWPTSRRRQAAVVAICIALVLVAIPWVAAIFAEALDVAASLDPLAYVGMMIVCWVGAGGALVPIPGARPLSWVLVVQQGAVLDPLLVALAAGLAMTLGQSSYFLATRRGSSRLHRRHKGHHHRAAEAGTPKATGPSTGGRPEAPSPEPGGGLVGWARRLMARAKDAVARLMTEHPQRTIFLVSVVPSPLTTFGTVAAAEERVEFRSFFVASLAGFLVLTTALVIAGKGILAAFGISAD